MDIKYLVNTNNIKIRKNEVVSYKKEKLNSPRNVSIIKETFITKKGNLCIQTTIHKNGSFIGIGASQLYRNTKTNYNILMFLEKLAISRMYNSKSSIRYFEDALNKSLENSLFISNEEVEFNDILLYDNNLYVYRQENKKLHKMFIVQDIITFKDDYETNLDLSIIDENLISLTNYRFKSLDKKQEKIIRALISK